MFPAMLLLPPLSTRFAGANDTLFWKILHLAIRALEAFRTFTPVPALFEMLVLVMFILLPAVGSPT